MPYQCPKCKRTDGELITTGSVPSKLNVKMKTGRVVGVTINRSKAMVVGNFVSAECMDCAYIGDIGDFEIKE